MHVSCAIMQFDLVFMRAAIGPVSWIHHCHLCHFRNGFQYLHWYHVI